MPLEDCFALLAAVDRYPDWCPDIVRDAEVSERGANGQPSRVRMGMHVARGALVRDFNLSLEIVVNRPRIVKLIRVTDHPTNQEFSATWLLGEDGSTHLRLELDAMLRVPRYIPAGGVADAIAETFVTAACRRLTDPR